MSFRNLILMKACFIFTLFISDIAQAKRIQINASVSPKPIKVFILDTGIDLSHDRIRKYVHYISNDLDFFPTREHGTHIAGIVLDGVCPEVHLISCNFFHHNYFTEYKKCLKRAIDLKVDVINFSGGGAPSDLDEFKLLKEIESKNILLIAAAGNDGYEIFKIKEKDIQTTNLSTYYPASYDLKNIIGVMRDDGRGNYGSWLKKSRGNNVFSTCPNKEFCIMSGTSQATANYTNIVLKRMCME